MPEYIVLTDAQLCFTVNASTAADAHRCWQEWADSQTDCQLTKDIAITILNPAKAIVLTGGGDPSEPWDPEE
jgi:hypothetical protein